MIIKSEKTGRRLRLPVVLAGAAAFIALVAMSFGLLVSASELDGGETESSPKLELISIPSALVDEMDADINKTGGTPLDKTLSGDAIDGLSYSIDSQTVVIDAADVESARIYDDEGEYYVVRAVLTDSAASAKNSAADNADNIELYCFYRKDSSNYNAELELYKTPASEGELPDSLYSDPKDFPVKGHHFEELGDYVVSVNDDDRTAAIIAYNEPENEAPASLVIPSGNVSGDASGDASATPAQEAYTITDIDACAFASKSFTSVTMPDTLKRIGKNAFDQCEALSEVKLNDGLETIGDKAFIYDSKLESIEIPASVKTIGKEAFSCCKTLKTVDFKGSEKPALGEKAFWNTPYALGTELLSLPESTLKDDTLKGDSVGDISSSRFAGGKLRISPYDKDPYEVTIPDDCKVTMLSAPKSGDTDKKYEYLVSFQDSDKRDYKIDLTLTEDGSNWKCDLLYRDTQNSWLKDYAVSQGEFNLQETAEKAYEALTYDVLAATSTLPRDSTTVESDDNFTYEVTDDEVRIKKYIGNGGDVTVPAKYNGKPVTAVLENAFKDDAKVTSVTFEDDSDNKSECKAIYPNAFNGCSKLESVSLPESLRYIGDGAFKGCALDEITVPPYVGTIGSDSDDSVYAFDPGITVKGPEGSAAEKYCKDNPDAKYKFEKEGEPVVPVPVKYDSTFMKGNVTITVKKPNADAAAFTLVTPHTEKNGCRGYIDNSKLEDGTDYDVEITRDGFTSYTITGYNKNKGIPSDIELYPGELNGDGIVDLADVAELVKVYGSKNTGKADFNEDGAVDLFDVSMLVNGYTKSSQKAAAPAASSNS